MFLKFENKTASSLGGYRCFVVTSADYFQIIKRIETQINKKLTFLGQLHYSSNNKRQSLGKEKKNLLR